MRNASVEYHAEISPEKLPQTINLKQVLDRFAQHSCHLGAWPENIPEPTKVPKVNETSHVVRDVTLNDNGGLDVSFVFITSPRGFKLMKVFDKGDFEMTPVISKDGSMIVRFDFLQEE